MRACLYLWQRFRMHLASQVMDKDEQRGRRSVSFTPENGVNLSAAIVVP